MLFLDVRVVKRDRLRLGDSSFAFWFLCNTEFHTEAVSDGFNAAVFVFDFETVVFDMRRECTLEHPDDLAVELFTVGNHLSETSPCPRNAFDQRTRDATTDSNREYTDVATFRVLGHVVEQLFLGPYIAVGEQHELGLKSSIASFKTGLDRSQSLCTAKICPKRFDMSDSLGKCILVIHPALWPKKRMTASK